MSQQNVGVVRVVIEAFNRGDWDAVLQHMASGFELDLSRALAPDICGVYGVDQMREVLDQAAEPWESTRLEPDEFIDAGEHVVVPWTFRVVGRDGIEVQARTTWSFTIRDGAVERICMYQEREEALGAARPSE